MAEPTIAVEDYGYAAGTSVSKALVQQAGSDRIVLIQLTIGGYSATPPVLSSVVYGGVSLSGMEAIAAGTVVDRFRNHQWAWVVKEADLPANGSRTFSCSASAGYGWYVQISQIDGVDQTNPINVVPPDWGAAYGSTTISESTTTTVADCLLMGLYSGFDNRTMTVTSPGVELHHANAIASETGAVMSIKKSAAAAGAHSMGLTLNNTSARDTMLVLAVAPATGGGGALTITGASQGQSAASVAATQHNVMGVTAAVQTQAGAPVGLTQHGIMAPVGAGQAQSAGLWALTQHNALAITAAGQSQAAATFVLTQHGILVPAGAFQAQASIPVSLTQHNVLAPTGAGQAQTAATVILTASGTVSIVGAFQAQGAASFALTQHGILAITGVVQPQLAEALVLIQHNILGITGASQAQGSEMVLVTLTYVVTPTGAGQAQSAESGSFTQQNALAITTAFQTQTGATFGLSGHGILAITGAFQSQAAAHLTVSLPALAPGPVLLQPLTISWDMPVREILSLTPDRTITWDMPTRDVESN